MIEKHYTFFRFCTILLYREGALAQLGARIAGSDEVTGSNPVRSTNRLKQDGTVLFLYHENR